MRSSVGARTGDERASHFPSRKHKDEAATLVLEPKITFHLIRAWARGDGKIQNFRRRLITRKRDATDTVGTFEESVTLLGLGQNPSGYNGALPDVTITLRGQIVVPEPGTAALRAFGLLVGWRRRR